MPKRKLIVEFEYTPLASIVITKDILFGNHLWLTEENELVTKLGKIKVLEVLENEQED